jgi:hypothetical protein
MNDLTLSDGTLLPNDSLEYLQLMLELDLTIENGLITPCIALVPSWLSPVLSFVTVNRDRLLGHSYFLSAIKAFYSVRLALQHGHRLQGLAQPALSV